MPAEDFPELDTPAALVDLERMRANLDGMAAYTARHDLRLRPHTKTHKALWIGREQLDRGARGLTAATLREAGMLRPLGGELLLAYPPIGERRARRVAELAHDGEMSVALDGEQAIHDLARVAPRSTAAVDVLIELDVGMRRCGVGDPAETARLASLVAEQRGLRFRGILFYPGHIREPVGEQGAALAQLAEHLGAHIEALRAEGLPPGVVSGGSTPTAFASHTIAGVNEIRPGTYVFNDRTTARIGACAWDQCAYSVLATVVSTAVAGQAVVDAGSKALAREALPGPGGGFGALLDRPDIVVAAVSEEHGVLDLAGTDWRPRVGERVRIVPNHVCVSVNLQAEIWGVRGGAVADRWRVGARNWALPAR